MLSLRVLGGLAIERDGIALDDLSASRKTLAVLAILAASLPASVSRDRLMALLWPDSDEQRARNSLKQALHFARRELGDPEIIQGVADLRLSAERLNSDI